MTDLKDMDVVYIVKEANINEELRYSLRSVAANLPHRSIIIVGFKPAFIKNVIHIPVRQNLGSKYANAQNNWIQAVNDQRVSEEFIYFNDDYFAMKPISEIPYYYRDDLDHVIEHFRGLYNDNGYIDGMIRTKQILETYGRKNLKSYELHLPMVMTKTRRRLMHSAQGLVNTEWRNIHPRTFYGNFFDIGGTKRTDVKVHKYTQEFSRKSEFLSSADRSFKYGKIGEFIRSSFPNKSEYER